MIGIQVSLNGKLLYTVSAGEFGVINANVEWDRTAYREGTMIYEHLWVGARAYCGSPYEALYWQNHELKVGDEISMRIVETDTADQPLPGMPDFPHSISN